MDDQITYVDVSRIREGKLPELKTAMDTLAGFVEENMPRLESYGFYLDEDEQEMTVLAVHPDSESLAFHLDRGREEFRKFSHLIELKRIDIYGPVADDVLDRLHAKAEMLGDAAVSVYDLQSGFVR